MGLFDSWFERSARGVAQHSSRRSAMAKLGKVLVGSAMLPLLPSIAPRMRPMRHRARRLRPAARDGGKRRSDELRLLEILRDRRLAVQLLRRHVEQLPTGHDAFADHVDRHVPQSARRFDYIVSYNDCCGKTSCGKCFCNRNEREKPLYKLSLNNDINWCMANGNSNYHCSVSVLLGAAKQ